MTLVELLVAIGIVAILIAITIPSVQAVREASRNVNCQNRLRQIGLATHQFLSFQQMFPHNGGWDGQQTIPASTGTQFTPATIGASVNHYGVGDPGVAVNEQPGSWLFMLLPNLEQVSVFQERQWRTGIETVICPSRRDSETLPVVDADSYATYVSGGWKWSRTDFAGNRNVFPGTGQLFPKHNVRVSEITDGLSNTVMAAEKSYNRRVQNGSNWFWDEPFFLGGSGGTVRWEASLCMDSAESQYQRNWGAAHPAGVNAVRCDGSIYRMNYSIAKEVFESALTIRSGD